MDKKIILEAVVGSKAYGLDTPESDEDIMGIFVEPTNKILGLEPIKETIVHHDPDRSYHEVGKFMRLAIKANPTILELLFLPKYRILTKEGQLLIEHRKAFLSNAIFNSYGGYAISQAYKLNRRGNSFSSKTKNRYPKHARHCFRLLDQGRQLLETGTLNVRVRSRERLFEIGQLPPSQLVNLFEKEFSEFKKIKSILPDKPSYEELNEILLEIRRMN